MKSIILALALAVSSSANAFCSNLPEEDRALFIASNLAIAADWQTTKDISRRLDEGYYEKGPIVKYLIGSHPTPARVDSYFAARFFINYYIACKLDSPQYKNVYLWATTLSHGYAANNNYRIGLRIRF